MFSQYGEYIESIQIFFNKTIWEVREELLSKPRILFYRICKIFYISYNGLTRNEFLTLASSLTFTTTFSLVPVLALSFAVAKGFGAQDMIQELIISQTVVGPAQEIVPKIIEYVNRTNVKPLGSIGLVILIFTALNVLGKIEQSFNKIWGVKKPRTFFRKFSDYLSVLTVGPILLIGAVGISTTLSSHTVTQKLLEVGLFAGAMKVFLLSLPWLCIIIALTFLYLFIPNTKIRVLPALLAGAIAGSAWQLVQMGYIFFQVGVAKYNAIYGTFASVPVFLLWVYVSWVIVLAGAEIGYACQNVRHFHTLDIGQTLNYSTKEKAALAIMLELCKEYEKRGSRLTPAGLSGKIKMPVSLVNEVLEHLTGIGYILPVEKNGSNTYVPSRPTDTMKLADFFQDFKRTKNLHDFNFKNACIDESVDDALNRYASTLSSEFKGESFKNMVERARTSKKNQDRSDKRRRFLSLNFFKKQI